MKKSNYLSNPLNMAIFVALFALLIRLAFIALYTAHPLAGGDPKAFWSFAEGIASGQGFRSTFEPWLADRPPLYSYFLAGIFLLGGRSELVVFIVQALLASVASAVFYLCAGRVLDKVGSFAAGMLFAALPSILLFTKQVLAEAVYIPLWVFLLASLLYLKDKPQTNLLVSVGVFLGLLALARREAILPGGLLVAALLWDGRRWRQTLRQFAIIFVVAALIIFPWLWRNYLVLGKPVLSSSGGVNFMVGNNPLGSGAYTPPPLEWQAQFSGLGELARDQKAWALSLQWIRENPTDFLRLLPKKLSVLLGPAHNRLLDTADLGLLLLCAPGLLRIIRRKEHWQAVAGIALIPVLTTMAIGMIFVGGWRYRLLIYPGACLLAGYGGMELISWYFVIREYFRNRGTGATPA